MAAGSDGQERTEEATPKRRLDARKKGTVARSIELPQALAFLAVAMTLPTVIGMLGAGFTTALRSLGRVPTEVSPTDLTRTILSAFVPALGGIALLVGTVMVVGVAVNFAQVGFMLSPEAMVPKWERIDPLQGLKRLFSAPMAMNGLKASLKAFLFCYLAYGVVMQHWSELAQLNAMSPLGGLATVGVVVRAIFFRIGITWLVLAAADYMFQRKMVEKQLKMTRDELKQEMKNMEQSPELRMAMAQRRRKLLKSRTRQAVQSADVVVTNPTHYAVAIQYEAGRAHAPVVVAKGQDHLALKIREIAEAAGVPIVPNPPLARALYRRCELGDFVPPELFEPVAEVLAFVYRTVKGYRSASSASRGK